MRNGPETRPYIQYFVFCNDRSTLLYWGNRLITRPRARYFVLCNDRGTLLYCGKSFSNTIPHSRCKCDYPTSYYFLQRQRHALALQKRRRRKKSLFSEWYLPENEHGNYIKTHFLNSPPQAPIFFWGFSPPFLGPLGGKKSFPPHYSDPWGGNEKSVSPP